MKLFHTPTSPFVRKCTVAAHELGLADRLELTFLRPSPLTADATLSKENPLNKIPALVLDDGTSLFDSAVIVDYFEELSGRKLVPAHGPERYRVLRGQALCDGILEASVSVFYERAQRPKELQFQPWIDGQSQKAQQGLDVLERDAATLGGEIDLAQICAGVTLGWLEFRNVLGDIRSSRPKLFGWYDRFAERPSMVATRPHT
jgi:glutathione S-transferase